MDENRTCEFCAMTGNHYRSFLIILDAIEKICLENNSQNVRKNGDEIQIRLQAVIDYVRKDLGYSISGNAIFHFIKSVVEFRVFYVGKWPEGFVFDDKKFIARRELYLSMCGGNDGRD